MDLLEKNNPSVLLMHSYYGVDTIRNVRPIIDKRRKSKGLIYIEDMTQSMFISETELIRADYIVGSIRKWVEVADGGFCISKEPMGNGKSIEYEEFLRVKCEAQTNKQKYLNGDFVEKNDFLSENRKAENLLYEANELYCMSRQSRNHLQRTDLESICIARNENMKVLDEGIEQLQSCEKAVQFENTSVPLYYPIYVEDRDKVQQYLQQHGVFAPVLWPKAEEMKAEINIDVQYIYEHLLALPCDQRYSKYDMNRIVNLLKHLEMNK